MGVPVEIVLIADQMFPEATLPDALVPALHMTGRQIGGCGDMARKSRLDQPPAFAEIGVTHRQGPDHMELIGQDHRRRNRKGPALAAEARCIAQNVDMAHQQIGPRVLQTHRKEVGATRHKKGRWLDHAATFPQIG
jgi:hypothetical protein